MPLPKKLYTTGGSLEVDVELFPEELVMKLLRGENEGPSHPDLMIMARSLYIPDGFEIVTSPGERPIIKFEFKARDTQVVLVEKKPE